jgi:hypothetical protein
MVGMITGLRSTEYEGKLAEIGLESLEARRRNTDLFTMHKLMHGVDDIDSSEWFEKLTGSAVTRIRANPMKC